MKKRIGTIIFCLIILVVVAIMVVVMVSNSIETDKKKEYEEITLKYVDAVEKQYEAAQLNSDLTTIEHGTYQVSDLTKLGVKIKGKMPNDKSIVSIDVFGLVSQCWLTFEDNYKVYYTMSNKEATATIGDSYLDSEGFEHNILPKVK